MGKERRGVAALLRNEKGQAFVEAAILFPIMIMIFAALVLLSLYLPARGALQRATQYAATAIATVNSDTWLFFDENSMTYYWEQSKDNLDNVYVALFSSFGDVQHTAEEIVINIEARNLSSKAGTLSVDCFVIDNLVYKEVAVRAEREFPIPIDLSFISFPRSISVTVSSTAAVQNGEEFVRNIDMAADFGQYILEQFGITDLAGNIGQAGAKIRGLLGW